MTVWEYSQKFVKLFTYATSLVSNNMDEMRRYLIGIDGGLEEECRSVILHDNMDFSKLMVHVHQVEDNRKKRGVRDSRRTQPQDQSGPFHGGHRNHFDVCEEPRFKKGQ